MMAARVGRTLVRLDSKWARLVRLALLRRSFCALWDHIITCSCPPPGGCCVRLSRYRRLEGCYSSASFMVVDDVLPPLPALAAARVGVEVDLDVVSLKVSLLGDCQIGKTSFMNKYVGDDEEQRGLRMTGLNLMDKVSDVRGARIVFSIWDVGGDDRFHDHVPVACKDAAAILIMFDLTSRSTLHNAIGWYQQARKWNKKGIPILIGTKFDDFVQLPLEMQWMIVSQARAYAREMKATLFFSSAIHNINVNKIFKFITAKLFSLPWTLERNLTIGEPIVDF